MNIRLSSMEQKEIVMQNLGLVYYVMKNIKVPPNDYEDIAQIGRIGLIKAVCSYNVSKNTHFANYAIICIRNEISMYLRKEKKHLTNVSLDNILCKSEDGDFVTFADIVPSSEKDFREEVVEKEIFIKLVSIIMNLLTKNERLIVLYEIAGFNQTSIAKTFNVSRSYVSKVEKRAHVKLKTYFSSNTQFKEVFSFTIVNETYQISFASKDIKQFKKIFSTLLKSVEDLPDFNINCNKGYIIISVPADSASFAFIAQIFKAIEEFNKT